MFACSTILRATVCIVNGTICKHPRRGVASFRNLDGDAVENSAHLFLPNQPLSANIHSFSEDLATLLYSL